MKLLENVKDVKTVYEPYKYIMSDMSHIYIGSKYSYGELLDSEELGFKMKAILTHYILKESQIETTLESEFYYMNEDSFQFKTYDQLKAKVKVTVLEEKKSLFGKTKQQYVEKVLSLKELTDINLAKKKGAGMVIMEIQISKLSLMSFQV